MLVSQKSARVMALFLAVCLLALPAFSRVEEKGKKNGGVPAAPAPQASGKLVTRGNQPVLVNGNIVGTGTTILTGATIQTFKDTRALVKLGALGNFELSPNSTATLSFGGNEVTGMLKRGCALLTTNASIAGALGTPDGMMTKTDSASLSSVNVCAPGAEDIAPATPELNNAAPTNQGRGIFGLKLSPGTTMGLLGAATYFAGVGTVKAGNGDTTNPNDCCCCCCCNPSPSRP